MDLALENFIEFQLKIHLQIEKKKYGYIFFKWIPAERRILAANIAKMKADSVKLEVINEKLKQG